MDEWRLALGKASNRLIKYLGPILIIAAVFLISGSIFLFYYVVLPLRLRASDDFNWVHGVWYYWHLIISACLTILVLFNFFEVCHAGPGFPKRRSDLIHEQVSIVTFIFIQKH